MALGVSSRLKIPENSVRLRQITFAAQTVGLAALAYVTQLYAVALVAVIIMAVGHYHAHRYRRRKVKAFRVMIFIAFHLTFCWMIFGIFSGQPYPQAQLAMLAMAVVAFELYSRLNLYSGMGLGLINLYVAATLSRDVFYAPFLLGWLALMLAFFWVADSEDGLQGNPIGLRPETRQRNQSVIGGMRSWGARFALTLVMVAPTVFIFTPHFAGRPLIMPISIRAPIRQGPTSEIVNPAVPLVQIQGWTDQSGEYYYGFDSALDLSYRGGLNDTLLMYVRSPAWSYWRSHAYDRYDGRLWTVSDDSLSVIRSFASTVFELIPEENVPDGEVFVQSYYIVEDLPNLVFTAGTPFRLYLAASELGLDSNGSYRVGEGLQRGTTYSVMSVRQNHSPDELRGVSPFNPDARSKQSLEIYPDSKYLQLPDTVTERTRQLALNLTADATTRYDAVVAVRDHLLVTYPYNFFPPPQAPNTDAVDQFLFVDQEGVCEQYVTAMVVMLRSLGIPARLVAGFGSGDFNQFTGYYEVRADDAHAWAEVYFPEVGWVPFDPTPGWTGNPQTGRVQTWVFSGLFDGFDPPTIPIGQVAAAGVTAIGAVLVPLLMVGAVVAAIVGAWFAWRRWNQRDRPTRHWDDPARRRVFKAYNRAQRSLKTRRRGWQTIREHARSYPPLRALTDAVDAAAYSPTPPDEDTIRRAEDASRGQK